MPLTDNLPEIFEGPEIEEYNDTEMSKEDFCDAFSNEYIFVENREDDPDKSAENEIVYGAGLTEKDKKSFDRDVENLMKIAHHKRAPEKDEHAEKNTEKKNTKINECLIILVICLLCVLVGERFIRQKSDEQVSVFYEIVNETQMSSPERTTPSDRININTANEEELMQLPGIGKQKADAILEYRLTYGKFYDISEIMDVPGIGEGIFEKIKDQITTE